MTQNFALLGPKLRSQGFEPIPVAGKTPTIKGWQEIVLHPEQIQIWAANGQGHHNVGLRTGALAAVDLDIYDTDVADVVFQAFTARFGEAPCRIGREPKRLLVYAAKEPRTKINSAAWVRPNPDLDEEQNKVEVLGIGQQFVAAGIHPDTHKPYRWVGRGNLLEMELWMLPVLDLDEVAVWIRDELPKLIPSSWQRKSTGGGGAAFDDDPFASIKQRHDDVDLEGLRWLLDNLDQSYCDERDPWRNVIFAAHHQFHDTEDEGEALDLVDTWSSKSVKWASGVVPVIWDQAHEQRGGGLITIGSLKQWVGLDKWAAYRVQRKATTAVATVQEQGWEARIAVADQATLEGQIIPEIRVAELTEMTRASLVGKIRERTRALGIALTLDQIRRLLRPPKAKAEVSAEVDLKDFIPYGLPEPGLNPETFPQVEHTETGVWVKNTIANTKRLLQAYGITAYYDGIKKKVVINIPGVSVCPDQADNAAFTRIESLGNLNGMAGEKVARFAATVAYENERNLIGDWIKSQPWDGQDRITQLCDTLTMRPDFPLELRNLLVRRWLISAVAAALKPAGFFSKGVLTLQGPQSIGKTAWVASLVPPHLDGYVLLGAHLDPQNRDSIKTAVSHWIVELGEVDSTVNRAEGGAIKAFIARPTDKLRLPYARADSEYQRRTVFAASVNPQEFLKDETGNVRWWTLPVTAIDSQHNIDLQQLWAQVAAAYESGEKWWLVPDEERRLESYNSRHTVKSSIHEMLAGALDLETPRTEWRRMTATEVLQTVLQIKVPTNAQAREAGTALRTLLGEPTKSKGLPGWWVPPVRFEHRAESVFDD